MSILYKYSGVETKWHSTSKSIFTIDSEEIEVPIDKSGVRRVADVRLRNGLVVECQHSSIDGNEIQARENFYDQMVWFFDASGPYESARLKEVSKGNFSWVPPRLSLTHCKKPVLLDLGYNRVIYVRHFHRSSTNRTIGPYFDSHDVDVPEFLFSGVNLNHDELYQILHSTDTVADLRSVHYLFERKIEKKQFESNQVIALQKLSAYCNQAESITIRALIDSFGNYIDFDAKLTKQVLSKKLDKMLTDYRQTLNSEIGKLYNDILWIRNSI